MSCLKRGRDYTSSDPSKRRRIDTVDEKLADITKTNGIDKMTTCTKCYVTIQPHEEAITTKCGHTYHTFCLRQWLKNNDGCYYCQNTNMYSLTLHSDSSQYFTHSQPYYHQK